MTQVGDKDIPTPECDKALEVRPKSQAIGEFLDWLQSSDGPGITLAVYAKETGRRERLVPYQRGNMIESLLMEFFEIDADKMEKERRALLAALQEAK